MAAALEKEGESVKTIAKRLDQPIMCQLDTLKCTIIKIIFSTIKKIYYLP